MVRKRDGAKKERHIKETAQKKNGAFRGTHHRRIYRVSKKGNLFDLYMPKLILSN